MIGYYIHHHGRGHLARATAITEALDEPVTAFSSLARPDDWRGQWIDLPLDTADPPDDPTAQGRLHWAPLRAPGLRERSAVVSQWISEAQPSAFVVDISVEITLLVRLHGIPTVTFALPGNRTDRAHRLGFDVATRILAAWPPDARGMLTGLSPDARRNLVEVGAISRFAPATHRASKASNPRRVLVLGGAGGDTFTPERISAARSETVGWTWDSLGSPGQWVSDVRPHLEASSVVVTHAGQGALADVSAARRPAIVIPQERPHEEQTTTGDALRRGPWPVVVLDRWPERGWASLVEQASRLDGNAWQGWNDGFGAARAAREIRSVAAMGAR